MTKIIILTQGQSAIIDDADFDLVMDYVWRAHKTSEGRWTGARGYQRGTYRENTWMHRLILNCPQNLMVDHIDGDVWNNRRSNLRIATNSLNQHNVRNSDRGAYYVPGRRSPKKWYARISLNGRRYYLGYFLTREEAVSAYKKAENEIVHNWELIVKER